MGFSFAQLPKRCANTVLLGRLTHAWATLDASLEIQDVDDERAFGMSAATRKPPDRSMPPPTPRAKKDFFSAKKNRRNSAVLKMLLFCNQMSLFFGAPLLTCGTGGSEFTLLGPEILLPELACIKDSEGADAARVFISCCN